ncbi:hypothetical protein CFC21_059598 [Triticum aestivum]|uniref:Uncharacterized protein n=2 Tax=Triticum aestivum TaxID=4565 RepID=A0A3B6IXH4_WHEAT|nr:uncharacterized protein LOC123093880 [Triticum aestivum]KAF7051356.1 hypothetical protein CFC21_059598 [Triticum aestivum]
MGHDSGPKRQSHSHSKLRPVPELPQTPCRPHGQTNRRYSQLKCSDGGGDRSGELRLGVAGHIPNFHCKSLPTRGRLTNAEDIAVAKRGSMYQSSSEITRIRRLQEEGRRKIDSAPSGDEFLSFDILDDSEASSRPSTSGSGSGGQYLLFSHRSRRSEAAKSSVEETRRVNRASAKGFLDLSFRELPDEDFKLGRPRMDCTLLKNDQYAGDAFLEISIEEEESTTRAPCRNAAPHLLDGESGRNAVADRQLNSGVCPGESDHHGERERVPASNIPDKSVSAKSESASHGTSPSECVNRGTESITKAARSSPFKKMLSPIMKSKSVRSSPTLAEKEDPNPTAVSASGKTCASRKSLLSDLSRTERSQASSNCQPNGESRHMTEASLSPAHLRAVLKIDSRNGVPFYDFCVEGPEESISARSWESGSELSRIYTFHSGGKRGSTAGRSSKDERRCLPPTVGQMHASSYLCSEVGKDGVLNNSVNTEFVLYDIAHARRSFAAEEKTHQCTEPSQPKSCGVADKSVSGEYPQKINLVDHQHDARNNPEVSTSRPWSEEDLYPHLEIAATVIQIPFNKDKKCSSAGTIKMVTPSGLHGLSDDNESSPSSLLDRWRYGGGCDCGGWDMACPLVVLENAYDDNWVDSVMKESKHPMELLVQGSKEELPALSMKADGKGQLLVDFHAQLSALQAFSACISLLHCSEASTAVVIEKGKHKLYSSSLKMLLEGEVMQLIEAVTAEEKKKLKTTKREKAPPSVAFDPRHPPFSPLGRV